jgi:hydrogenase-4 component F
VEVATNHSRYALSLLVLFGIISILVAAAFILAQHDVKRLLAYHSVEHLGIITLGLGIGGLGIFAGLFHTLTHSVCKTLSFFCAGRLGQMYHTHDMQELSGTLKVAPIWGVGLLASILALIGVAPFSIFMSELVLIKAALENHALWSLVFFLFGSSVVFVGALKHAIQMAWGESQKSPERAGSLDYLLVLLPLGLLIILGLWLPDFLTQAIHTAALIVGGKP